MASLIPVSNSRIKSCRNCGGQITLIQNRHGKWFAVDVFKLAATGELVYRDGVGMHRNLTPWHKCAQPAPVIEPSTPPPVDPQAERKAEMARRFFALSASGLPQSEVVTLIMQEYADLA